MGDLELSLDDIITKKFGETGAVRGRNNVGSANKPIRKIKNQKMGDLELSLDDIITKKFRGTGVARGRNNVGNTKKPIRRIIDQNSRVRKAQNAALNKNIRNGAKNTWSQSSKPAIGDARLKIIQKKRQKVTDAREKLGQIAKQTDARLRLVKLRERQRTNLPGVRIPVVRSIPDHLLLQRTVQSRLSNSIFDEERMDYMSDGTYLNNAFPERGIINDSMFDYPFRTRPEAPVLYRTVENDLPHNRMYEIEKNKYTWTKPISLSDVEDINIPVPRINSRISLGIKRNDDRKEARGNTPGWDIDDTPIVITKKIKPQETVSILKRSTTGVYDAEPVKIVKESPPPTKSKPIRTLSERFCQDGNLSQKMSLLKAKLEASQRNNKNGADAQSPLGHKIIVSNLVPSVTHEDVKELFEDIGELISSKVVRPGTAEVIYKLHKDAVRAVYVYHNRQLDGQPMKCLLVENRLKGTKTAKAVVEVDMTAFRKALHKKSTS